jgi:TolB-like protein/DNA-binding winged helix-turn-helix (wHTH) protein/Tfp pilus assembly protein PilF
VNARQDHDSARYRFSVFELDAAAGELRKQGLLIRLQGQPLQILLALLERPGVIVTRDELRQRLWPGDTFVEFDHSLNTAVKRLRETIGDTASTPRFVETMPRRGYRFMAPVERLVRGSSADENHPHPLPSLPEGEGVSRRSSRSDIAIARTAEENHLHPLPTPSEGSEVGRRSSRSDNGGTRTIGGIVPVASTSVLAASVLAEAAPAEAAPAKSVKSRSMDTASPPWSTSGLRRAVAAAIVLALLAAGALLFFPGMFRSPTGTPPTATAQSNAPRLAVLPFENLTGDPARAHVAEGFTEELVAQLGRLAPGRLGVIARSSSASFRTAEAPPGQVARALGVDYLIEGSVRGAGDRYRVAVSLVRTSDPTALWSELYEGSLLDLIAVQRDVGQQVARRLALALLPEDQAAIARATTSSSRAYESYLRGLSELARGPSEGFARATELFQRAIADDPRYALAHAGLAESYILQETYYMLSPDQAQRAAKAAALQALAIDDSLAEAHCALANVLSRAAGETAAADREFARALALNPSRAATQLRYATHLIRSGRAHEGRDRLAQARQLAPRSADVITEAAWMEMDAGRLDEASALAGDALRYQPEFPFARYLLGHVALRRAAPQDAIAQFEQARVASGNAPKYIAALATAYLAAARPADAARALDELRALSRDRYVPPGTIEALAARLESKRAPGTE